MVISYLLRCHQVQIQALSFIDFEASGYISIDQNFGHKYSFYLYKLKYLRRLF